MALVTGGGASGGGTTAGALIVRRFAIAFNTAGILTGHAIYTPTIGDMILGGWFSITTAWDGTTPSGDIGTFVGSHKGLIGNAGATTPADMTVADSSPGGTGLSTNVPTLPSAFGAWETSGGYRVTAANPIKVVVSQNGQDNGADPVPTQGAGFVFLLTATPT